MNWITASLIMFFASVAMYLLVRYAGRNGVTPAMQNVSMFTIPTVVYLIASLSQNISLKLNWMEALIIIITAYAFSYLGSRFSMNSIAQAPNPGYSLIISKSYVVMTTVISVFVFNQELTVRSFTAIILIVIFSAVIMIDPKTSTNTERIKKSWLILAIGAFICWGMLSLASKYLFILGMPVITRLFWVTGIASLFFVKDAFRQVVNLANYNLIQRFSFLLIGILSALFNYFMQLGIQLAPNVGFVNAINASSISIVTIGAVLIFKDDFTWRKFSGVIGVTVGLILLLF